VVEEKPTLRSFVCNARWMNSIQSKNENGKLVEHMILSEPSQKLNLFVSLIKNMENGCDSNVACMGFV
jgi:hypothetical protein